jgi:hypothetical protein
VNQNSDVFHFEEPDYLSSDHNTETTETISMNTSTLNSPQLSSPQTEPTEDIDSLHLSPSFSIGIQIGSNTNAYLRMLKDEQKRKRTKERRKRRMEILRMKRLNGEITFDDTVIRYKNKRRR